MQVLIVEDEMITALHMRKLVTEMGHEVVAMVMSGEDAITMVRADYVDLIFMDTRLRGELSGYDAAEIIWKERNIPIVFFSGDMIQNRDMAHIPYHHTIIKKPFTDSDVESAISYLT
jgi:CheY-like chemotaxis protein